MSFNMATAAADAVGNRYKTLNVRRSGPAANCVVTLEINRPAHRNTWTEDLRVELCDAIALASEDDSCRCIVLTGNPEGRAFCSGMNLSGNPWSDGSLHIDGDAPGGARKSLANFRDGGGLAALALLHCTKPSICAINGNAVGVGATLPLACDIRVVAANAKIGYVFAQRGLTVETCASFLLPRIVGRGKALEWCLTGRVFKAVDEASSGLFNYIEKDGATALDKAYMLATEIATNTSPIAVTFNRWLLTRSSDSPEQATLDESKVIGWVGSNADVEEGIKSFKEKRKPEFTLSPVKDMPDFVPWWRSLSIPGRNAARAMSKL